MGGRQPNSKHNYTKTNEKKFMSFEHTVGTSKLYVQIRVTLVVKFKVFTLTDISFSWF